jgi:sialic acid synthase SpsE
MKKIYIIAEMAWGHMGSLDKAIEYAVSVNDAGADAISIHITNLDEAITRDYKCLAGQTLSGSADNTVSIYEYLDQINLTKADWLKFDTKTKSLGLDLVAMCNDMDSYLFSQKMKISAYVLSAASFLEYDLIEIIAINHNDIILRIGGATINEIDTVINFILDNNPKVQINLLAGIQLYPTPIEQLHIESIKILKDRYKNKPITLGLADHIDGDNPYAIYLPALALPLGITTIEKHITTDRKEKLEDYEAALGFDQFKDFVRYVRIAEKALGDGSINYLINDYYEKYRQVSRKKIVARTDIKEGEVFTKSNVTYKRSDYGASMDMLHKILGNKANKKISRNQGITLEDINK